jgi:hypothetical protein
MSTNTTTLDKLATHAARSSIPAMSFDEPLVEGGNVHTLLSDRQTYGQDRPSDPKSPRLLFAGRHSDGRFRLKIDGKKFLVNGAIYAISQSTDHTGGKLWLKLLLDMTPGYRVSAHDELSFDVVCSNTNARMLVMGVCSPYTKVGGSHNG